jgi:hypothetical protein
LKVLSCSRKPATTENCENVFVEHVDFVSRTYTCTLACPHSPAQEQQPQEQLPLARVARGDGDAAVSEIQRVDAPNKAWILFTSVFLCSYLKACCIHPKLYPHDEDFHGSADFSYF